MVLVRNQKRFSADVSKLLATTVRWRFRAHDSLSPNLKSKFLDTTSRLDRTYYQTVGLLTLSTYLHTQLHEMLMQFWRHATKV